MPPSGGVIGAGAGTAIGGPIGGAVGGVVGNWASNLFGGGHQPTIEHVNQLFQEFPQIVIIAELVGPLIADVRERSQGIDPYDPNFARWWVEHQVMDQVPRLIAANNASSISDFEFIISEVDRAIPGLRANPDFNHPRHGIHIQNTEALWLGIKLIAQQAIQYINSGQSAGGPPIQPATPPPPVGSGGAATGTDPGGGNSITLPIVGTVSKAAAVGTLVGLGLIFSFIVKK